MSNAEVEREIIEALEASSEPLDRHALFKECPSALSADHVSRALNSLKKHDTVPLWCGAPKYKELSEDERKAFWRDVELGPPCRFWEPIA